jgi:hypothetical protein
MKLIMRRSRGLKRRSVVDGDVGRCDQEMSCVRLVAEVESMEALGGRFELNEALRRVNFEYPSAIMAIISDMVFLAKQEEGEDIGDAVFVDIDLVRTEISDVVGRHNTLVAVDLDGTRSWTNVVDVSGV